MTSFLKKLVDVRNRSKSPTKQVRSPLPPPHFGGYPFGTNGYSAPVGHSAPMSQLGPLGHVPPEPRRGYQYGSMPRNGEAYNPDYSSLPPAYLPLPPSPMLGHTPNGNTPILGNTPMNSPIMRNSSRMSTEQSNQSNESVGIHSWNTEKSDTLRDSPREYLKTGGADDNSFYLNNKDFNSTLPEPILFDSANNSMNRTRSHSPRKERKAENGTGTRSKSPHKKRVVSNTLDYLNSQCHLEGCSTAIVVHSTRFLICRHQLCHASEYFKNLLMTHRRHEDIHIAVSGMSNPPPTTQFRWFVESCIPCPALKDISDDTLETCMRLAKRFQANILEVRCSKYLIENACNRQPLVVLCWLNWCLKHKFDPQVIQSCLPTVARLSLATLEQHRHMMSEKIFADILAAKLRGCYQKAVHVFRTIHRMDHFSVDLERCPRCNRTKDGMRVKVNSDPCRKQLGCDRCLTSGCELEQKAGDDLQAFYQCEHGLLPLNDTTDDCQCQTRSLALHLGAAYPIAGPETLMEMDNSGRKARSKERKHRKDNRNTD